MIKLHIERALAVGGYQLWIFDHRGDEVFVAKPMKLEFVKLEDPYRLPEATLAVGGILAHDLMAQVRQQLAGMEFADKEEYQVARRIEKAMQAHIDSLKYVVERTIIR